MVWNMIQESLWPSEELKCSNLNWNKGKLTAQRIPAFLMFHDIPPDWTQLSWQTSMGYARLLADHGRRLGSNPVTQTFAAPNDFYPTRLFEVPRRSDSPQMGSTEAASRICGSCFSCCQATASVQHGSRVASHGTQGQRLSLTY